MSLESYRISNVPASAFLILNFVTEEEEKILMEKIYSVPRTRWVALKARRLQNWGGLPSIKGMIAEPLPAWLTSNIFERFKEIGLRFSPNGETCAINKDNQPNHVLINEYLPGQGIMPHTDGPFYNPIVATISIGSHTILNFTHKENLPTLRPFSLYIPARSLFVQSDELYHDWLHGIDEVERDIVNRVKSHIANVKDLEGTIERMTRISLTYRRVGKTIKPELLFGRR